MNGARVGSLLFREYDALMIAQNGGKAVRNADNMSYSNTYMDFMNLVQKLEKREIDGIAVDQFTMMFYYWVNYVVKLGYLDNDLRKMGNNMVETIKDRIEFLRNKVVRTKIPQKSSHEYSCGILVKNRRDNEYFKDAAENLGQTIEREWEEDFSKTTIHDKSLLYSAKNELFSYSGTYFQNTVIAVTITVLLICLFGVVYESMRKGKCGKSASPVSQDTDNPLL